MLQYFLMTGQMVIIGTLMLTCGKHAPDETSLELNTINSHTCYYIFTGGEKMKALISVHQFKIIFKMFISYLHATCELSH